jgi:hypothetical protein
VPKGRLAAAVVALAVAASGLSASVAIPAAAAITDPATNVAPSPDYWPTCSTDGASSAACASAVVAAIDHARSLEGVAPMRLPAGFDSMNPAQQTFVVSNLERVDRGLQPAAGMVGVLDTASQTAAKNDADPTLPSWTIDSFNANRWGSNWAGDLNALAADYDWMYADGWGSDGSFNMDCTSPGASGCWGHRHNILSSYGGEELVTGVGYAPQSQWTSIAQIFVAGSGPYPAFAYSWTAAQTPMVAPGTSATPTGGQHSSATTMSTSTVVVAGHAAGIVGRLLDAVTGTPVADAAVLLCHRTALETTGSCASTRTDATGSVRRTPHPFVRTVWWLAFTGNSALAASSSRASTILVKNAVRMVAAHTTTGWALSASFAPVRGQIVRLQVRTATGWKLVSKLPLRTRTVAFRVGPGRYRVWVAAVRGLIDNYAYAAAR